MGETTEVIFSTHCGIKYNMFCSVLVLTLFEGMLV